MVYTCYNEPITPSKLPKETDSLWTINEGALKDVPSLFLFRKFYTAYNERDTFQPTSHLKRADNSPLQLSGDQPDVRLSEREADPHSLSFTFLHGLYFFDPIPYLGGVVNERYCETERCKDIDRFARAFIRESWVKGTFPVCAECAIVYGEIIGYKSVHFIKEY